MRKLNALLFIALMGFLAMGTTSCSKDDDPKDKDETVDLTDQIENISSNVVVATYKDLAAKGEALYQAAEKFKNSRTGANLDAAKQAWRSARQPWEQSEGFLFGPVDDKGIDPAIDSWPVNVVDMDQLLNDTDNVPNITAEIVDKQIDEAKGFHLIEYLLWGLEGNKQLNDFTDREVEYVAAACENLRDKTAELYNAWIPSGENYLANFLNAGTSGKYKSQKDAVLDLVTGMIGIADEVGNAKIEDPYAGNNGQGDVTKEESRFSHNSKLDFANNIRSISNVYYGKYQIDGIGISDLVASYDADLDTRFQNEISAAITAIESIPGTFTDAIISSRPAVAEAQSKVQKVMSTLESDIKPLLREKVN